MYIMIRPLRVMSHGIITDINMCADAVLAVVLYVLQGAIRCSKTKKLRPAAFYGQRKRE